MLSDDFLGEERIYLRQWAKKLVDVKWWLVSCSPAYVVVGGRRSCQECASELPNHNRAAWNRLERVEDFGSHEAGK